MTTTPTSGAADLLDLIEAYAEARHRQGHSSYNTQTAAALQAVKDALAAGQATAPQGVAYAALPEKYYLAGGEVPTWDAKQMRAFADATNALRASHGQAPAPTNLNCKSEQKRLATLWGFAPAQADSVQEDAALWHWLAEYLVGTRTDLDDEIVASETVNDLRKLVKAAIKQGEKQ